MREQEGAPVSAKADRDAIAPRHSVAAEICWEMEKQCAHSESDRRLLRYGRKGQRL